MDTDVLARVQAVAAEVFNCDPAQVQMDTVAHDVDGWDSLTHTIFIMSIEKAFGIRFNPRVIFSFSNVGDLVAEVTRIKG